MVSYGPGCPGSERHGRPGLKLRREAIPTQTPHFGVDTALFFLLVFLFVWLVIDARLIHHSIGIFTASIPFSFSTGWAFFREHLCRPGGLVEYAARWFSQWYSIGWAGALIITAVAWCTCICTDVLTRAGGRPRGRVARYVPAVLLVVMWAGYSHPLRPALSLLAALACFALYLPWARPSAAGAIVVQVVLCVAVYFVAGAGGLLFPVLVAVYELLVRRRWLVAVTAALGGLGVALTYFFWGPDALYSAANITFGKMTNYFLAAIPLFVFMATILERSGVAEDLYAMMYRWMGGLRGGLAMGTILICTVVAAMSGLTGVGAITMGLVALPAMLKRKYDKRLVLGCIPAGGALGALIPPSLAMILYGIQAAFP